LASRRASPIPAITADPRGPADPAASVLLPSRHIRKILRLEARARRLLARYEGALAAATRAKGQAHVLLDEAQLMEGALDGAQLDELHRGRARAAEATTTAGSTAPDHARTTTPG